MSVTDHETPPSVWCDWWQVPPVELTPDIAYGWPGPNFTARDEPQPWFWHWCPVQRAGDEPPGRWMAQSTGQHQLVSVQPLHLEPSLLWPCCGTHGWVRDGLWIPA